MTAGHPSTRVLLHRPLTPASPNPSAPGFEILEELGRGGMGVVYKARQIALNRVVALKMVLAGPRAQESDQLRFLAEAEAVAAVRHANVVEVFEFGHNGGVPYFAMELLEGGSLSRLLYERGPLPPGESAILVEQIARGLQAAHDVGVIHRDLKPGNILFKNAVPGLGNAGSDPGTPSSPGASNSGPGIPSRGLVPKITDFGLAKRGQGYDLTTTGVVMGTPAYMAPEQATGNGKWVGPTADIYALGVVLYECLIGRPPFEAADPILLLGRVVRDDPVPVRRHARGVPEDLDLICLKCLAKVPAERYATAAALAADLSRFLNHEPVSVRPAGRLEKAAKWVRRHPAKATTYGLGTLAVALLALTAGFVGLWRDAESARDQTALALARAEGERAQADTLRAEADTARGTAERARTEADTARATAVERQKEAEQTRSREIEARQELAVQKAAQAVDLAFREYELGNISQARTLLDSCPTHLRPWEWKYVYRICHREVASFVTGDAESHGLAFAPDSRRLITAGNTGVREWDPLNWTVAKRIPLVGGHKFGISGDSRRVAAGGQEGVEVIDRLSGTSVRKAAAPCRALALDRDGSRVVACTNDDSFLWSPATGSVIKLPGDGLFPQCCAFSPDGERVVLGGDGIVGNRVTGPVYSGGILKIWSADGEGKPLVIPTQNDGGVWAVAFDRTGNQLAVGTGEGHIVVCDTRPGGVMQRVGTHSGLVNSVAFELNGFRLASAGVDRTARVWDPVNRVELLTLKGHTQSISKLAFSPDGKLLATTAADGTARVWDLTIPPERIRLTGFVGTPRAVTITNDGTRIAVGGEQVPVQVFDARTGLSAWSTPVVTGDPTLTLRISPDGTRLTGVSDHARTRCWDLRTGAEKPALPGALPDTRPIRVSEDLSRAVVWDPHTCTATVIDARTGEKICTTGQHLYANNDPLISPDGTRLLTSAYGDRSVRVWDAGTGKAQLTLTGHVGFVRGASFSPDGTRIATGGADGWVKLWDAKTGREVLTFHGLASVCAVGFSPDGSKFIAIDDRQTAHIFDSGPPLPRP
ncbi:MAG: hypothetical protein JWO38_2583 [Gemmataceae bacterium]|nr:hypothetical protein [Gemmataceae bacterium]